MSHIKSNSLTKADVRRRLADERRSLAGYRTNLFLDLYWPIQPEWDRRSIPKTASTSKTCSCSPQTISLQVICRPTTTLYLWTSFRTPAVPELGSSRNSSESRAGTCSSWAMTRLSIVSQAPTSRS